jgi:hypothetical protein
MLGGSYVTFKYLILGRISLHHLAAGVPFPKISCAFCVKVKVRHALRAEYILFTTASIASHTVETCSFIVREEHIVRASENKVQRRIFEHTKEEATKTIRQKWHVKRTKI